MWLKLCQTARCFLGVTCTKRFPSIIRLPIHWPLYHIEAWGVVPLFTCNTFYRLLGYMA